MVLGEFCLVKSINFTSFSLTLVGGCGARGISYIILKRSSETSAFINPEVKLMQKIYYY